MIISGQKRFISLVTKVSGRLLKCDPPLMTSGLLRFMSVKKEPTTFLGVDVDNVGTRTNGLYVNGVIRGCLLCVLWLFNGQKAVF